MIRKVFVLFALFVFCGTMALAHGGCRDEGPAERMGRGIDEAVEELEDSAEDIRDRHDDRRR